MLWFVSCYAPVFVGIATEQWGWKKTALQLTVWSCALDTLLVVPTFPLIVEVWILFLLAVLAVLAAVRGVAVGYGLMLIVGSVVTLLLGRADVDLPAAAGCMLVLVLFAIIYAPSLIWIRSRLAKDRWRMRTYCNRTRTGSALSNSSKPESTDRSLKGGIPGCRRLWCASTSSVLTTQPTSGSSRTDGESPWGTLFSTSPPRLRVVANPLIEPLFDRELRRLDVDPSIQQASQLAVTGLSLLLAASHGLVVAIPLAREGAPAIDLDPADHILGRSPEAGEAPQEGA